MKVPILIPVSVALIPLTAMAGSPGLVTVVGGPPVALNLNLPASSAYKFTYDPARISIWDTVTKDNLIAPSAEFTAPAIAGDFEPDCDVDLRDVGNLQICFTGAGGGPPAPGCDVFDFEPDSDVDLTDFGVLQPNVSGPGQCGMVPVTVFVEGLTPSTTLGDTTIDVLTDPDGDGTFDLQETQGVTVVQITVAPTTVQMGTAMVVGLQPTGSPLVFDTATTASWTGDYVPTIGPTVPATITYDASQVLERSDSECLLIAGGGSSDAPLSAFLSDGTLVGAFTFDLNGLVLSAVQDITVSEGAPNIYAIDYMTSDLLPALGDPANSLRVHSGPVPTESVMLLNVMHHYAAVVPVEKTAETIAGPTTINVQVMTLDSTLTVVQDSFNLTLVRLPDNTDPNYLLYASDLYTPLFPLNVDVDPSQFTQVIPFETVDNGFIIVVGEGVQP